MTVYFTLYDNESNIEVDVLKVINYHHSKELVYRGILEDKAADYGLITYSIIISDCNGILNKHCY